MSLTMGYHTGLQPTCSSWCVYVHNPSWNAVTYPIEVSAAILCTGGLDVIRKEAWPFYRTSSGVRLCWELEEPKGPKRGANLTSSGVRLCWELEEPEGPKKDLKDYLSISVLGGCDVIRKEAGLLCSTSSSDRLWWDFNNLKGLQEQERGCPFPGDGGVSAFVSVLQQRVVRERTPGPSCPQNPAGSLSTWPYWSCNQ